MEHKHYCTGMIDYPYSESVTLKEALEITKNSGTPSALNINNNVLVQYDKRNDTYHYYADLHGELPPTNLDSDQLECMVPDAKCRCWIPAGIECLLMNK